MIEHPIHRGVLSTAELDANARREVAAVIQEVSPERMPLFVVDEQTALCLCLREKLQRGEREHVQNAIEQHMNASIGTYEAVGLEQESSWPVYKYKLCIRGSRR